MHLGHFEESESALRQALVLDPKSPLTHVNLTVCLEQAGKIADARKQLKYDPDHSLFFLLCPTIDCCLEGLPLFSFHLYFLSFFSMVKSVAPEHPWLLAAQRSEDAFDVLFLPLPPSSIFFASLSHSLLLLLLIQSSSLFCTILP